VEKALTIQRFPKNKNNLAILHKLFPIGLLVVHNVWLE
jgi:hypothetical protein